MPTDDKTIAQLHQKASSHYLQGEFDQALSVWRELLAIDSSDERAVEGVRLCELLANDGEPGAQAAPAAPATPAPERALPDPAIQSEGIDMGDLAELESLPLGGTAAGTDSPAPASDRAATQPVTAPETAPPGPPPVPADDLNFEFDIPEKPEAEAEPAVTGVAEADPASAQLNIRVEELYLEALEFYEQGKPEEAMGLLCRLFILDESNDKGLALQEKIRSDAETPAPTPPAPPEDLLGQAAAPEASEELLPQLNIDAPLPATVASSELDLDDSELEPPSPPEAPAAAATGGPPPDTSEASAEPSAEAPVPVAKPKRPARRGLPVPRGLAIGLAGITLAAVGVFAWLQFSGGKAQAESQGGTDTTIASIKDMAGPNAGAAAAENPEALDTEPAPDPAGVAASPQDIDELLAEARAAFEAENYAAAVVAYDKIVTLDPEHGEAAAQLQLAGKLYREQQDREERWADAIRMFNEENYRGALHALYRVETNDPQRLERYRRNSWFNMGLLTLKSGDCRSAQSHFEEAVAIDGGDAGAATGVELARTCRQDRSDRSWYERAQQMRARTLDD